MKPIFLFLTLVLCTGASVWAQQKRDTVHHAAATKKKAKMKEELKLTDKQVAEVKASKKEYKDEKEKVKNDPKTENRQLTGEIKK